MPKYRDFVYILHKGIQISNAKYGTWIALPCSIAYNSFGISWCSLLLCSAVVRLKLIYIPMQSPPLQNKYFPMATLRSTRLWKSFVLNHIKLSTANKALAFIQKLKE